MEVMNGKERKKGLQHLIPPQHIIPLPTLLLTHRLGSGSMRRADRLGRIANVDIGIDHLVHGARNRRRRMLPGAGAGEVRSADGGKALLEGGEEEVLSLHTKGYCGGVGRYRCEGAGKEADGGGAGRAEGGDGGSGSEWRHVEMLDVLFDLWCG